MTAQPLTDWQDAGDELTAAELAALARLDDGWDGPDGDDAWETDPDCGPPPGWLVAPDAQRRALVTEGQTGAACTVPDAWGAGFTHRDGGAGGGRGFAAGGVLDRMEPCGVLAMFTDRAWSDGLGRLSDDELAGMLCAARRNASRQAALELAVVAELAGRRARPDGRPGEHLEDELAAALTLTGRAARQLAAMADGLARLPHVAAALAAGRIDVAKAAVFAGELVLLDDLAAAAIAAVALPDAPGMTTGRLRAALRHLIEAIDPQAALRRREEAQKDARVETWAEAAGTAALAGRDLSPASVIVADKALDADARWLKAHGACGGHDRLRADALIARLTGQPLESLLPATAVSGAGGPGGWQPGRAGNLGGSVNLTMPAAAWLRLSDAPGEIAGTGPADAATCRDLADALSASTLAHWCLTVVDRHGRAVGHGCARAGPGPPGSGAAAAWLASIKITPVATGTCGHRRQSAGYQPSGSLRHLVKVRSRRCGFPGCRRPATACDDDHTIPHHLGGRTCECNLHPLCRRHHKTKQASGWRLDQPHPGELVWTTPSGRQITVTPEPYPA